MTKKSFYIFCSLKETLYYLRFLTFRHALLLTLFSLWIIEIILAKEIKGKSKCSVCVFCSIAHLGTPYLNVVVAVVVKIENSVDFGVTSDPKVIGVFNTFRYCLSRVFFHLDIVELSENIKKSSTLDYTFFVFYSRG